MMNNRVIKILIKSISSSKQNVRGKYDLFEITKILEKKLSQKELKDNKLYSTKQVELALKWLILNNLI